MSWRLKMTIVHDGEVKTFNQLAEGESRDEFLARALCDAQMQDGDTYYYFQREGHMYAGHVTESQLGHKCIYHPFATDEHLPGLFLRKGNKVYDYREAP